MSAADKELEDQLVEVGHRLADPPVEKDELLALLDKTESILTRVDQSPSTSIFDALRPAREELVSHNFLRHSDLEVKVSVASCVSEITRITAPDAPYDDDRMKVIFQLIVEAFKDLHDMSSPSFVKRLSILETVAKVRSCVVMLDLECDTLILDMFQYFLKTIRPSHPEKVFTSMELIMTLVLEESEDISPELISCLLDSVKLENKETLPVGHRLGVKVISKAAVKLKPYLVQAQSLSGSCEYSSIVASICQDNYDALEQNEANNSGENMADDSKLSDRTVSDELPQGSTKTADEGSPGKNATAEKSPTSVMKNGTTHNGDQDSIAEPTSSNREPTYSNRQPEVSCRSGESKDFVPIDRADSNDIESTELRSDTMVDKTSKKTKGRKPNTTILVKDSRDNSGTVSDDVVPTAPSMIEGSQLDATTTKKAKSAISADPDEKKDLQVHHRSDNGGASLSSPTPSEDAPGTKRSKRGRPAGSKVTAKGGITKKTPDQPASIPEEKESTQTDQTQDGPLPSEDANFKKEPETHTEENHPSKKRRSETASEDEPSDSDVKSAVKSGKRAPKKKVKGGSSMKKQKSKRPKVGVSAEKTEESSLKISETVSDSNKKRKLDESIVGSKIKVWWPEDEMYYEGRVDEYIPSEGRHKIVYEDEEVEVLLLKDERFVIIGDDGETDEDQAKDVPSPLEVRRSSKTKVKGNPGGSVPKQGKNQTPMKSAEHDVRAVKSSASKPKGRPRKKTPASKSKYETLVTTGHDSSDEDDNPPLKSPVSKPKSRSQKKSKETPASKSQDGTSKVNEPDSSDEPDSGDETPSTIKPRGRPSKKSKETPARKTEDETPKSTGSKLKVSGRKSNEDTTESAKEGSPKSRKKAKHGTKDDTPKSIGKLMEVDTPKTSDKSKDKSSQDTLTTGRRTKPKGDAISATIGESDESEKGKRYNKPAESETPAKAQGSQGSTANARKRKGRK